jgi:RHS repeat-associated protein
MIANRRVHNNNSEATMATGVRHRVISISQKIWGSKQRFLALFFVFGFVAGTFSPMGSLLVATASAQASQLDLTNTKNQPKPLETAQQQEPTVRTEPVTEAAKKTALSLKDPVTVSQELQKNAPKKDAKPILSSEFKEKRTAFSNTYLNNQGGETVRMYTEQVNYQPKGKKDWQSIVGTPKADATYNKQESDKESLLSQLLPGKPFVKKGVVQSEGFVKGQFRTPTDGITISFDTSKSFTVTLLGANGQVNPAVGNNDDGTAYTKYSDAWKNTDVYYEQRGETLKEYILLKSKDVPTTFSFKFAGAKLSYGVDKEGKQNGAVVAVLEDGTQVVLPQLSVASKVTGPMTDAKLKYVLKGNQLDVVVDPTWLAAQPTSAYPIVVDPTYSYHGLATTVPGGDTGQFVAYDSRGYTCNSYNCDIYAGTLNDGGAKVWRSMMRLPLTDVYGKSVAWGNIYTERVSRPYVWSGFDGARPYEITWANCFGFHCFYGSPRASATLDWGANFDATALMQWISQNNVGDGWLMIKALHEGDIQSFKAFSGARTFLDVGYIRYNQQTAIPTLDTPAQNASVAVSRPTLRMNAVGDPDGDVVRYAFHLIDSKNNIVAHSGELDTTWWTIPDNVLVDGEKYTWKGWVMERNAGNLGVIESNWRPTETRTFTFDLRTGKDKTQTFDDVGPYSVSLNKGNGYTGAETHSLPALGGSIGAGLSYNTPGLTRQGLTASYYNGIDANKALAITVEDPNVDMVWGTGSPYPGTVQADYFSVNWKGYFIAPETGNYVFGSGRDDHMIMSINGQKQFEFGCCGWNWATTGISLVKGQAYPIDITYLEATGYAAAHLDVRLPSGAQQRVPSEWLRTIPNVANEDNEGLTARFYKNEEPSVNTNYTINDKTPLVFTTKVPQVNRNWGTGTFVPYDVGNLYVDHMIVNYSGYLTIPTDGEYEIGTSSDDGARVRLGGKTATNNWPGGNGQTWTAKMQLKAGEVIPISLDYFEATGPANLSLSWRGPAGNGVIPASYLSTTSRVVPRGWNVSVDVEGNIPYETIQLKPSGNAELIDGDGFVHLYTWTGTGFKPPVNEGGYLVRNGDSTFTLNDVDGRVYVFSAEGVLTSVTSPQDEKKPAALRYEYRNTSTSTFASQPKLNKIVDPVDASRYGQVYYWGEQGADTVCSVASGFETPKPGYLCAFKTFPDAQTTKFYYKGGQLARVEQPGNELMDYAYDAQGRITKMRDVMANDLLLANLRTLDTLETEVSYDNLYRVSKVLMPAPFGATVPAGQVNPRFEHVFEYGFQSSTRKITGQVPPSGYDQYIEYDNLYRTTKSCDAQALCNLTTWDASKDLALSTTDPTGLVSTIIYDSNDMPTDNYGPGRPEYFDTNRKPKAEYDSQVPHTQSMYDEGIVGPAVGWYDYKRQDASQPGVLFGAPRLNATGLTTAAPGVLTADLTQAPITAGAGMQGVGFSATGKLRLPAGKYWVNAATSEGVRVWVDDQLVVDAWVDAAYRGITGGSFTVVDGQAPKRLRIDTYRKTGSTGAFSVSMKQDFGFDWTSNWSAWLKPDYNLTTSTKVFDPDTGDVTTKTNYGPAAELGLAQSVTEDAGGLNLATSLAYEARGAGFLRQTSKTMPGGNKYTYTHYGATETRANPCVVGSVAVSQAGFVKGKAEPDPDGTGTKTARTQETVYDSSGRAVAARFNADPWVCTTYDARGRITKRVIPTVNGRAGRTITKIYNVGGNPLVISTSDAGGTIKVENDLLGRTVRYTDVKGYVTNSFYDDRGNLSSRTGPLGKENFFYDQYDRLLLQRIDDADVALITYDQYGRTHSVAYPSAGQQKVMFSRDHLQRPTAVTYITGDGQGIFADVVSRSVSGDVLFGTENGQNKAYVYDKAGRLTNATLGSNTFAYSYAAPNATFCNQAGTNLNAYKNANRTSMTVNGATTTYCYDQADRLTKSSDPKLTLPVYDDHGNTKSLGSGTGNVTSFGYDASDRNNSIAEGANKVTYVRDVQGRITNRTTTIAGVTTANGYGYTSSSDTPDVLKNAAGAILEKYFQLPGNVLLTVRPAVADAEQKQIYSLPNMHGDTMATTSASGKLTGTFMTGPFGEKLASPAPVSGQSVAPGNAGGKTTFNYVGQHEKFTEDFLTLAPVQMGARVYIASLGRFLQVDPIEGGTQNDYVYPVDPINTTDTTGLAIFVPALLWALAAATTRAAVPIVATQAVKQTARQAPKQAAKQAPRLPQQSGSNAGIYKFNNTPSGKPYIGKSKDVPKRMQQHSYSGKFQGGTYEFWRLPYQPNLQLRIAEQKAINAAGGVDKLHNRINSISPTYWDDLGIK